MNAPIQMAKKDLLSFFRSKSTIFWTLAFPLMMMLLFSSMFGGSSVMFKVALVNEDSGIMSSVFVKALNSTNVTSLVPFSNIKEAKNYVMNGRGSAVLVIPKGFSNNLTSGLAATIYFYSSEDPQVKMAITSMIKGFVDAFLEEYRERMFSIMIQHMPSEVKTEAGIFTKEQIVNFMRMLIKPIDVRAVSLAKSSVTSKTANYRKTSYWKAEGHWVTMMLAYSLIFSGMVSSAAFLSDEKLWETVKRILVSPVSRWSILIGKLLGSLAVVTISQIILVALTILWLRPQVNWSILSIPIIIAGDLASIGIGFLVAELSPNPKAANEGVITIGVMIQFISGLYFPVSFLPGMLRVIAEAVPFTWAVRALDGLLVFGRGLEAVWTPVLYLIVTAIVLTSLSVALFPKWARIE